MSFSPYHNDKIAFGMFMADSLAMLCGKLFDWPVLLAEPQIDPLEMLAPTGTNIPGSIDDDNDDRCRGISGLLISDFPSPIVVSFA